MKTCKEKIWNNTPEIFKNLFFLFLLSGLLTSIPSEASAFEPKLEKGAANHATENIAEDRTWTIQGQVMAKEEPPYPISGVNISIKGSSLGTISDQNGYFSIQAKRGDMIVFNFLGFKPYEYVVSRAISNLSVSLKEDSETLDEVIITGFAEEKKLNSISSISSLDVDKSLISKPVTQISQSLQGSITGLSVTQSSGQPGADGASINIRGISTLGSSAPLILVDGVPQDMNNLDPNTIESITILKDAAAAAIYGARAANGVIVIKTKRGQAGKVSVSYNGYFGLQKATFLPEFVDATTYMEMVNLAQQNVGSMPTYTQDAINNTRSGIDPIQYPNTDWSKFIYSTGYIQSHSVSVSGGGSLARFALSANYLKNDAMMENTGSNRYNLRANTSVSLLDNLSVNMDFSLYRTDRTENLMGINDFIYTTPPNTVARYPMAEGDTKIYYGNRPEQRNPAAIIDHGGIRQFLEDNININIAPRWEVIPNLVLRGQFSYRVSSSVKIEKKDAYNFFDYATKGFLQTWNSQHDSEKGRSSYYYIGATAEYTLEKKAHRLFSIIGYNQELTNDGDWDQWALMSMFAKVNYTYNRRYLLEATIRRDGSSRFARGCQFGEFPSVAAGWNIHEEKFMKSLKKSVNELKVRASYGLLGNENIGLYKYQTLIDPNNGNEINYGNPDITWETVRMMNLGIDIRLFKNLTITFDYYDKLTSDMIITPPISYIGGSQAAPLNAGKVRNRGWEFDINYYRSINKDFSFNIHAGLSQNKNKIEELFGAPYDNGNTIHQVGYALNSYYVYPTDGLLQESDFEKDEWGNLKPREGVVIFDGQQPGDIHYIDRNGDKKIDQNDRIIRGSSQPDLNYFANLSLNYKKWDLDVTFQGVTDVEAYYSEPYSFGLSTSGDGLTPLKVQTDFWTPVNTSARYPRLAPNSTYGNNNLISDFWRFNANYCRVKSIQLGYTFDQIGLKKIGISSIRIYANAQNPFTIAKERLADPESRGQKGSYPLVKTYSFGLNLNF